MSEDGISKIDTIFQKCLLEALEQATHDRAKRNLTESEKDRLEFLAKWHRGWIMQDLSAIHYKQRKS